MSEPDAQIQDQPSPTARLGSFGLLLPLLVVAVIAATVLVLLERVTEAPTNAARRAAELAALQAVLPPTRHDNDLLADSFVIDPAAPQFSRQDLLGLSTARSAYRARVNNRPTAVILPMETDRGFRGRIVLLIGIDTEGAITGVRAVEHNETPGLGDRIDLDKSRWILSFDNRSLANTDDILWGVKRDGGEFDQFVGATVTPRAVVGAVRNALDFFEANRAALLDEEPVTP